MKRILLVLVLTAFSLTLSAPAYAERQPAMKEALEYLQKAEYYLNRASRDKGGHLKKALRQTRAAIKHVKKGMRFDNRH